MVMWLVVVVFGGVCGVGVVLLFVFVGVLVVYMVIVLSVLLL